LKNVLVVAASAVVRAGLESIVSSSPALQVAGSAAGVHELATFIEESRPDVLLIDLARGQDSASSVQTMFSVESGDPAVVILIEEPDASLLTEALRLGGRAVLPRDAAADEIIAAVEAAAAGLVVLHQEGSQALLPHVSAVVRQQLDAPVEALTPREIEVLGMLAEGAGNKLIARRLGISEHTVKFHVGSILGKLSAASRTEAVALGMRLGLIMV
jgi:two-component system, NarL family, response regulator YdfI